MPCKAHARRCSHPPASQQIRRFNWQDPFYALQCLNCLRRLRKIRFEDLPQHGVDDPGAVPWAVKRKSGKTGLGGSGNSKRREYEARFKRADWPRIRERILRRDHYRCQVCGQPGNQIHHRTYERFGAELDEDLEVRCRPCNQQEREQRITRHALGG